MGILKQQNEQNELAFKKLKFQFKCKKKYQKPFLALYEFLANFENALATIRHHF